MIPSCSLHLRKKIPKQEVFLAAMSSSRSDNVTKSVCVCVSVVIFSKFEVLDVLEARCFIGVINVSNRCRQGVLRVFSCDEQLKK